MHIIFKQYLRKDDMVINECIFIINLKYDVTK